MNREQRRMQARADRRAGGRTRRIAALGSGAVLAMSAGGAALTIAGSPTGAAVNDTVTTLNDTGGGSLRAAIEDANANGGGTIAFQPGLTGTITLASDLPEITETLSIVGPGASAITINGNNHREFYLDSVTTLTISGLTLTGGSHAPLQVYSGGTIAADSMAVTGNTPDTNRGGGVNCLDANLTVTNSVISGNTANSGGGGFYLYTCNATIVSTTIADNQAVEGDDGGGFYINGGTVSIQNSTISGNFADDNSAAIYIDSSEGEDAAVTVSNSTIVNNTAQNVSDPARSRSAWQAAPRSTSSSRPSPATTTWATPSSSTARSTCRVVARSRARARRCRASTRKVSTKSDVSAADAGPVTIVGSILTGNGDTTKTNNFDIISNDNDGTVSSNHSIIGTAEKSVTVVDEGGTQRNVDPMLGALGNNGGPTQTMALLTGSPAIDKGPVPVPSFPLNENDQRGVGFPRVVNGAVDVGAFEVQPPRNPNQRPR